jgi:hypothetical protein
LPTPSRHEVEHLHRLMMQSSIEAADLDRKVWTAQQHDGLSGILKGWREPAVAVQAAFLRAEAELLASKTPRSLVDRIESRFGDLLGRCARFDPLLDLRACVEHWKSLAAEFAQLSGKNGDRLLAFLERFKQRIDETTSLLSASLTTEGMVVENHRALVRLRGERDKAREKYERLRQQYLQAEQDWMLSQRGPAVVRLPQPKKPFEQPKPHKPVAQHHKPPSVPAPHHKPPPAHHKPEPRMPAHRAVVEPNPLRISIERSEFQRAVDREHHHRDGVAYRLERTLSHLATAEHRTLTDAHAAALRGQLARLDSVLARLNGAAGDAMLRGAGEIGQILSQMGSVASSAGGAPHVHSFKKLLDERRAQMSRVAAEVRRSAGAAAMQQGPLQQMPSTQVLGEGQIQALRRQHPGLDKLLRNASQAHLGAALGKIDKSALAQMFGRAPGAGRALSDRNPALQTSAQRSKPEELGRLLADLEKAPAGGPLQILVKTAGERGQQRAERAQPPKSNVTAAALLEVFREHPKGNALAPHLAAGGVLHTLCETAQRGIGLPVGQSASHFLQSRGEHALLNSVSTFHSLVKDGHSPRLRAIKSGSHAASALSRAAGAPRTAATTAPSTVRRGIGSAAAARAAPGHRAVRNISNVSQPRVGMGNAISHGARGLWHAGRGAGGAAWGGMKRGGRTIGHVAAQGINLRQSGMSWVGRKIGQGAQREGHKGIEWVNKTGVVGAVGGMLRKGVSLLGQAAKYTPLGYAVRAGYGFVESGGLSKVSDATKGAAGKAWAGIKTAGKAVGGFLQSPEGQLLVTGLSLAATFIPGGLVVKTLIGAGIGAISAISEGKDWKGVLLAAGSGALTGGLPFLKLGPLAKMGAGALSGAVAAVASSGNWKDAVKGAAGGGLDNFSPGALKALGKVKGISTAGKLLRGGKLSKGERAFMEGSKAGVPLRGLEKLMAKPGAQRAVGGLEKVGRRTVKGGIWVSGKAAQAQNMLDKAVSIGGKAQDVLEQVHQHAPELAGLLGDNAAGQLGDWAGKGDDKLSKALAYGQTASDDLSTYRGYLDKGLNVAGVKDPSKAYDKMMSRQELLRGRKGGLEHLAQHRRDHPEQHEHPGHGRGVKRPMARLEQAIARGRALEKRGARIVSGVETKLGKVHDALEKGLSVAGKMQDGLEKASGLAQQGAGFAGADTDLGKFLSHAADRADHVHGLLEQGIGLAEDFNSRVDKVHGALADIPGVHDLPDKEKQLRKHGKGEYESPLAEAAHLGKLHGALDTATEGKRAPHEGHDLFHRALEAAQGHHEREHEKKHGKRRSAPAPGGGGISEEEIAPVALGAAGWVASFGKVVQSATRDIEALMREGKTTEAGDCVEAVSATSEQTRAEVTRAVDVSHRHPALAKQAAEARQRYFEIRGHFFKFVSTLQGLGGQTHELEGIDGRKHPDLLALSTEIDCLQVKVDSLGEVKHADTPMQGMVDGLEKEATDLHVRLTKAKAKNAADPAGLSVVEGLRSKLAGLQRQLGGHGDKQNIAEGDAGMDLPAGRRRGKKGHDPAGDLLDGLGEDGRIFLDRGGARGDMGAHRGQDVDGAAMDTWIGSGEGVKAFSEVFGAFIPAEGALVQHGAGGGGNGKGFFHGLFEHLHRFADKVGGIAQWGAGILGKGMHYAEMGMHGFGMLAGGLETADEWMGKGKRVADQVEEGAGTASGIFEEAEQGKSGALVDLFKKSRAGDGIDGRSSPEKMRLDSQLDEPRRLDVMTIGRMERFLGGSFAGVRIHTGPGAAEITRRFSAEAVTVKDHIFFAPGKFNPSDVEGQKLLAHELTHVMQRGRRNMDVRTAESEAIRSEHAYGSPDMETLNLAQPQADFRIADGEGVAKSDGVYTARANRSRGRVAGGKDTLPDGEEILEQISARVYELLMEELEQSFESR